MKSRRSFLAEKKTGLILRAFATDPNDVEKRIAMIKEAAVCAQKATVDGQPLIKRIDVLVWKNKEYKDSDCGQTAAALNEKLSFEKKFIDIHVREVTNGDPFCFILNYGVALQLRAGCDYSTIVSAEAFSYMTPETMALMVDAACQGALAIGVAINELTRSILEGRIANTFAMWHNMSLLSVGGFDFRAKKPLDDRTAIYKKGWSQEKKDVVYYHLAGVEEVIPLARMADSFGPCIAPITPQGKGFQEYIVPDPATQPELWERHVAKMGTKLERQSAHLAAVGYDISFLRGGVMPAFRQK